MWRPAAKGISGTNDVSCLIVAVPLPPSLTKQVPLGSKRRFGLPEEAPPPQSAPNYNRPPPEEVQYFNGRVERDRIREERDYRRDDRREERPREDYGRREEYGRRDERDAGRDDRGPPRERDDRGGDRDGGRDRGSRWDVDRIQEPERGRDTAAVSGKSGSGLTFRRTDAVDGPRKRRSRWGDAAERADVSGLPTSVTGAISGAQLDNYAIHVRLEEINKKLRTGDVVPPEGQRDASPPPQYDAYGRRTNTRELRYRQKLEDERLKLVDRAMKADPNFRPPTDVFGTRKFGKPQDKVYIPVKEFPEINFFGLLVGPRGNSLKNMERASGAKISIRGKGSVKEGKQRPDAWAGDEDDELHCLIMADDERKVKACVALIQKVIETVSTLSHFDR